MLVRLNLDLSPAGSRSPRCGIVLLGLGAAALLVAGLQLHTVHAARSQEADRLQELQARIVGASDRPGARGTDGRVNEKTTAFLRDLRVPWPGLLAVFEAAANPEVTLLGIDPAPAMRQVRFTAEAKSTGAMLDYIEALMHDPLTDVVLISHQLSEKGRGAPIRFQAQAKWNVD